GAIDASARCTYLYERYASTFRLLRALPTISHGRLVPITAGASCTPAASARMALILLLPWAMMLSLDGFHNSSAVILWSGLCPLLALVFCELRPAAGWLLAFLPRTASSVSHDPSMS